MEFKSRIITSIFVLSSLPFFQISDSAKASEGSDHRLLTGSLSGGSANFNVLAPTNSVTMNPGFELSLEGEKGFGFLHLFLVGMIDYTKLTGSLNYNYASPTANYSASNINYSLDDIRGGFGVRLKIIEESPVRPYVEAGALGGYLQISYDNSLRTPGVLAAGNDFKTIEGVIDFGTYAEAGFEIDFSSIWGLKIADRYWDSSTRPLQTVGNQSIHYWTNMYMFGLYSHF